MKRSAFVVLALMLPAPAAAQDVPIAPEPVGVPDVPPGYGSARLAAPAGASAWLSPPPEGLAGMRNPVVTTTADAGLLIAGTTFTLSAYLTAVALSAPFAFQGCNPWARCQPNLAVLSLLPLAHWAGGFSGSWGAAATFSPGVSSACSSSWACSSSSAAPHTITPRSLRSPDRRGWWACREPTRAWASRWRGEGQRLAGSRASSTGVRSASSPSAYGAAGAR